MPNITLVHDDLPSGLAFPNGMVAVDTETTGLSLQTDKLCLVQVGDGEGNAWLVKFTDNYTAPNLCALMTDPRILKIFHYARFDLAFLQKFLPIPEVAPAYCTKIASKLARNGQGKHNLRTLCYELLGVELDKTEQMSNWAAPELTESQKAYAASDVLYLHGLHAKLNEMLAAQNLSGVMANALRFLPTRVEMDLRGLPEADLFSHH